MKRENNAAYAALIVVFGLPFLNILTIAGSIFGLLVIAGFITLLVMSLRIKVA